MSNLTALFALYPRFYFIKSAYGNSEYRFLVSNNLTASAQEITENYKQRWQIELLFKWLKQHLKLKRFLGRSANAVKLQLRRINYFLLYFIFCKGSLKTRFTLFQAAFAI